MRDDFIIFKFKSSCAWVFDIVVLGAKTKKNVFLAKRESVVRRLTVGPTGLW